VAITPAAGYVSGPGPLCIGAIAGAVCCYAVRLKARFGYDDALDVVGVHFVGGLVGSLLIGFFSSPEFFGTENMAGIFYGGDAELLLEQALANGVTIVYSFVVTTLIMLALKATIGVRVSEAEEMAGLDLSEHGETAYHGDSSTGRSSADVSSV
jgi:Amt family ammonium transporter